MQVVATEKLIRCTYAVTTGCSGTTCATSTVPSPPSPFTMSTPAGNWYFIVATCDMDGNGGTNAQFFTSSVDTQQQKSNYGS
jgi:hypothetical protein